MHPFRYRKVIKEGIPADHTLQVQHYIRQTGREWGLYTANDPVGWEFYHAQIRRDEGLLGRMQEEGEAFWGLRMKEELPDKLYAGSAVCRTCRYRWTCQGSALFDAVPEYDPDEVVTVESQELIDLVAERDQISRVLKEGEELKEANSDRIREILGGPRKVMTTTKRSVYWLKFDRVSVDGKTFRKEEPIISQRYEKTSIVNSLQVY